MEEPAPWAPSLGSLRILVGGRQERCVLSGGQAGVDFSEQRQGRDRVKGCTPALVATLRPAPCAREVPCLGSG